MSDNSDFAFYLDHLSLGCLEQPFKRQGPAFACELSALDFLLEEAQAVVERDVRLTKTNLDALAARLILGRNRQALNELAALWTRSGSGLKAVNSTTRAIETALSERPSDMLPYASPIRFSPAHANFVASLYHPEIREDQGPIGRAVRASRFYAGEHPDGSIQDEKGHSVGFPITLDIDRTHGDLRNRIRCSSWLSAHMVEVTRPTGEQSRLKDEGTLHVGDNEQRLADECKRLIQQVEGVLPRRGSEPRCFRIDIPDLYLQFIHHFGIQELDSAGLALALQRLADDQHRTIPAGVGFTGRWEDGKLQSVTGIRAKLRAAREAGIFVLFACVSQEDLKDLQCPEPGVTLVLLQAGSPLDDVVVRVNTVCHDLGVTEYRWCRAVKTWEGQVLGNDDREELNRLLPYAAEKTCPVGFVGRDKLLSKLDQRKKEIEAQGGSGHIALVGSPRSGKTTTLSHWIFQREGMGPRPPVWFSFLRTKSHASSLVDLKESLRHQIGTRFCVLFRPNVSQHILQREDSPFAKSLESLVGSTLSRIDLVVDGLDEAEANEQSGIAEFLRSLPLQGQLIIGTQHVPAANRFKKRIEMGDLISPGDAEELLNEFAEKFLISDSSALQNIGTSLGDQSWRNGLIRKSGGHLWILTEFLVRTEERDGEGWPHSPEELPLGQRRRLLSPDL